jgi:hypothetical protein
MAHAHADDARRREVRLREAEREARRQEDADKWKSTRLGRGLEEIQERIGATLDHYELMEQEPEYTGLRREHEAEASISQVAEAGAVRVDLVLLAFAQISEERRQVLSELRTMLDQQRLGLSQADLAERRIVGGAGGTGEEEEELVEPASLVERLNALEELQHKLGAEGEAL